MYATYSTRKSTKPNSSTFRNQQFKLFDTNFRNQQFKEAIQITLRTNTTKETSMANQPIMHSKFIASEISPQHAVKNKSGGQSIPLKYKGEAFYMLQSPVMTTPFGISEYTPDNGPTKFSLELSFKGHETIPQVQSFMNTIENIDKHMIELAVANSSEWFGKKMSPEVVAELYRPLLKPSKQPEKYAPTLKMKIRPNRNDETKLDVQAFTREKESFDITTIIPGTTAKAIFDIAPIWFVNKQFGTTLTLLALEVHSLPMRHLTSLSFQPEDGEEDFVSSDNDM